MSCTANDDRDKGQTRPLVNKKASFQNTQKSCKEQKYGHEPTRPETKNDFAGKDQQFTGPDWGRLELGQMQP
jgi:hypothetical protein